MLLQLVESWNKLLWLMWGKQTHVLPPALDHSGTAGDQPGTDLVLIAVAL